MGNTTIEWTDKTWSPIRARVKEDAPHIAILHGWTELAEICERMKGHVGPHCEVISTGCNHCYSCTNNHRCLPSNGTGLPFDKRSRELVDIFVDEKILGEPLRWRKPVKVFVENQSDLFGEWVPFEFIDKVFAVMALTPQHTYQILTKRPERMREYCLRLRTVADLIAAAAREIGASHVQGGRIYELLDGNGRLENVWLGVSVEDQLRADERIPKLLQTPAAVRFVSYEPALSAVNFRSIGVTQDKPVGASPFSDYPRVLYWNALSGFRATSFMGGTEGNPKLDWIIVGGESGAGARPFNIQWARDVVRQCQQAGVACFVKQLGAYVRWDGIQGGYGDGPSNVWPLPYHKEHDAGCWHVFLDDRKGGSPEEWPEDLRVREFPSRGGL